MSDKVFVDTNIFLYLLSNNTLKKDKAKSILKLNPYISTQVLNEFTNVCLRRLNLNSSDTKQALNVITTNSTVCQIMASTTIFAIDIKERYKFQFYDSLILASSLENDCGILYSEDMQNGQIIENRLKIVNPFV